jgi:succinate dehydrogenase / fumarate reductase cytochrome b subunit
MASKSSNVTRVLSSSVGTKLLIGVTGILLVAYMVVHLIGNTMIFFGRDVFNQYSHFLLSNPLIVPIEIALLLLFVVHIYKTVRMWMQNSAARPVAYERKEAAGHTSRKSFASSTMIASGLFLLVFVVIHVKQFKFGTHYLVLGSDHVRDLYRTEIEIFRNPLWVAFYVIATLLVALHMRHGISSAFQSLGLDHPRYTRRIVAIGIVVAIIVGGGLAIIPIWSFLTHY